MLLRVSISVSAVDTSGNERELGSEAAGTPSPTGRVDDITDPAGDFGYDSDENVETCDEFSATSAGRTSQAPAAPRTKARLTLR